MESRTFFETGPLEAILHIASFMGSLKEAGKFIRTLLSQRHSDDRRQIWTHALKTVKSPIQGQDWMLLTSESHSEIPIDKLIDIESAVGVLRHYSTAFPRYEAVRDLFEPDVKELGSEEVLIHGKDGRKTKHWKLAVHTLFFYFETTIPNP